MTEYKNQSVDQIQKQLSNKFEKDKQWRIRDDQEIYLAGQAIINETIGKIQESKNNWGKWALEPLKTLEEELVHKHNSRNRIGLFTDNENKRLLNDIAQKIDNAENIVLERLVRNNAHRDIIQKNTETKDTQGKSFFNFDKKTDTYIFTDRSNKPKIHEVLGQFFTNDKNIYTIDYSKCTNLKIKNKMQQVLGGTSSCLIKYDKKTGTYNLISNGAIVDERALIWEGVSLRTAASTAVSAKATERANNEKATDYSNQNFINSPKYQECLQNLPASLRNKLSSQQLATLISKTESRLDTIIKEQKKLGWELEQDEPISRIHFGSGLMEAHFINRQGTKKDEIIWKDGMEEVEDNEKLNDQTIYNILDNNEGPYKDYLTARIKAKWAQADHLTKREQIFSGSPENKENPNLAQAVEKFSYGLDMLSQLVNKIEEEDGTSKEVAALKVAIRNYKYSLENTVPSSQELDEAKKKLGDLFVAYKSNDGSFSTMKDTTARETVANLLSGDKTNAQRSIRELGKHLNVWGNTKTTFLKDEIANNENISFGKLDYTEAFQKIGTHLEIGEKDTEAQVQEKTKLIDNLYNCANAQAIFSLLQNNGLIPANAPFDEEMKKGCQKIYDSLRAKKQAIEQLDYSPSAFQSKMENEKIKLEAKGNNLTDDDRIRLQSISVMLENPQMLQEALQNAKSAAENSLKYEGIGALLKGSLALPFAKNGGKMSGTNADIFNSSHGLNGRLSYSDETAVWLNEIGQMILEEVAICIVAIALGAVTGGVGTAAIYGARFALKAAQGARYANKAYKIKKTFTLMRKLSKARKYWKMGREAEKLVAASRQVKKLQKGAKLARTLDKSGKVAQRMKYANKLHDARISLDAINKSNKFVHLNDLAKIGKLTDHLARGSHLLFEGTGFHLSSTVLRNALHGKNLTDGVNPFGYTEGPNGEQISNFRGYVQSIAFLGILKAIGQPLQNLTGAALQKLMGEKIAGNWLGKALQGIASVGAEVVTLMVAEQGISLALDQEPSPITVESAIQSLGIVIGLRLYGWGSMKIKNWKEGKHGLQEITVENGEQEVVINGNGTVISSNTPNMPVGKNVLIPRMNESTGAYGKNATQEQLMRKREQLNQEITKLKNQGIASTDPKIATRENAVKFIENKLNSASYKEISLPESNKVSIKNASYNMAVNRYANGLANVNEGIPNEIQLRPDGAKIALERNGKYKDIFDQYESLLKDKPQGYEQKLQELDFMLAERVTLDTGHTVEYAAKSEAETSFKGLKKTYPESELRQFESSDGTFCIRKKLPEEVKLEAEIQTKKTMRDANNTMIQELSRKIDSIETELKTKKEKSVEEKADEISKDRPEYYEKYAKESHTDLYEQYKTYQNTPNELKRLDTEFAERLILDNPGERKILFSEKGTHGSIKERAENSFKLLSKVEKYKGNIKLVQKTLNGENVFVIELIPEIGKLTNLKNQVIAQEGIIRGKESELSKMQKKGDGLETIDESTTMFRSQESGKEVGKAETANNTNLNTKQNQIGQNMEQGEQIGNENLLETQIDYQKKQIESNNKKIEALEQKKSNGEELSQNEEKQLELLKRANDALTLDIQSVNQGEGKFYNASAQVDLLFQKAQTGEIPYKDIKLDWVSKSMFEASVFLQGMKKWISMLNLQTPIEFIKKISHSLEAIKVKFGDRISTQGKKLMEFYSKQLKLIEAKKQQARELQENKDRELQENKDRELQENKDRELQENKDRELQENKDRENSSKEYNDQNPDNFYSKKISKEELLEIHKAQKTEKAEIYLKEGLAPENTIYLPNGEKIYVTDKCTGYGRFQLVGYAIENGKINIRLFYRSSSEGCWRSSGGLRSDGALSKGEFIPNSSYETTTKVDHRLGDIFDKLNSSKGNKNWTGIESPGRGNSRQLNVETLKKGMLESIKIESVLFPELPKDAVLFYYKKISQHVINGYNNLVPKGLNYSEMKLLEGKSYSYKHEHLGNIRVDACTTGYNGKDVYIYFARAEGDPSKVRIENIVYADAKINSYGVYDKQINAGPLVAKPIDYAEQLPLDFNGKMYGGYGDIRYLYQGNPIIKKYKSEILSKKIKLEGESKQGERINLDLGNYENKPEISDFEKGRIIDMNGRIHEGEFENGYLKKGKMTDTNGTIFEGEFKYGELNGTGKVIASDGTIYQGEFKDGELNGTGKAIDPDGTIYQGEFKDGELNGRGKITTPYGLIHEGEFKNRELNGKGEITVPDGTIYEGEFKNQLLDGEGSILKPDGHKEIGVFREGKLVEGNVIYPDR